jgi:alpha-galactosidase
VVKISFVGAGSAAFSMTVIRDLCLAQDLSRSQIVLMDSDEARLDAVYSMARRYAAGVHAELRIEKTTHRRSALEDADFVIDTVLIGGHAQQEIVREVGERHGYYRGVEAVEFNMIQDYSTTFQGYYQLKFFSDLARDMEELCPDALLIDVANPECEAGTLLTRETKIRVAGYCHGYLHNEYLASNLGLDPAEVDFEVAGFNHNIWLTKFRYKGEDAYPVIDEWIETKAEEYWESHVPKDEFDIDNSRAAVDMYRIYGLFPIGDTVRSGSWKYHYDLKTKKYWYGEFGGPDSEVGWASYLRRGEERTRNIFRLAREESDALLFKEFPPVRSREKIVPLIDSIANDKDERFVLDVRNDGAIPGLPDDVAVEIPVRANRKGIRRKDFQGGLPPRLVRMALIPRLVRLEMALEAFHTGDKSVLLEILHRDARTKSDDQARDVLDGILELPFNEEMRKHYGG